MKNRLIGLLNEATFGVNENTLADYLKKETIDRVADHLLANGVIVPPCKVGSFVYVLIGVDVCEYQIESVKYDGLIFEFRCENPDYADEHWVFYFFDERIGKTVFLTKAEAEKALAERSNNERN